MVVARVACPCMSPRVPSAEARPVDVRRAGTPALMASSNLWWRRAHPANLARRAAASCTARRPWQRRRTSEGRRGVSAPLPPRSISRPSSRGGPHPLGPRRSLTCGRPTSTTAAASRGLRLVARASSLRRRRPSSRWSEGLADRTVLRRRAAAGTGSRPRRAWRRRRRAQPRSRCRFRRLSHRRRKRRGRAWRPRRPWRSGRSRQRARRCRLPRRA